MVGAAVVWFFLCARKGSWWLLVSLSRCGIIPRLQGSFDLFWDADLISPSFSSCDACFFL
jgi:hypothetical protein